MRKLAVIANKMPVRPVRKKTGWELERGEGGLVSALTPVLLDRGGSWFGNDGSPKEAWDAVRSKVGFDVYPIDVPRDIQFGFYTGFANAMLWPLFHGFLGKSVFKIPWWHAYRRANELFADTVAPHLGDSEIWVHDYHFFLLPDFLRQRKIKETIRFFLHIPFPSYELFRHIPWRNELLSGLVAADEVGFHTPLFRDNFLFTIEHLWGKKYVQGNLVKRPGGGTCVARVLPISVDTAAIGKKAEAPEVKDFIKKLDSEGKTLIVGVDRLDYTKGIPERLEGFEMFLERNPEQRGKVTYVQVAVPSRGEVAEYDRHRRTIEQMVGHINGRFSEPDWTPIRYLNHTVTPVELSALYKAADMVLVTPIADGMNLVAKEYVAAKAGSPGVLILSEFAGAAAELAPHAMLVNPHNIEGIAGALSKALSMPYEAKVSRMQALYDYLLEHDIHAWVAEALASPDEPSRSAG